MQNSECSLGALVAQGFRAYTLEPPWKDNKANISCIPPGEYECHYHRSPKYGWVYIIMVEGRSHVLFHWGNLPRHTRGCVLLGSKIGTLKGQTAVLMSKATVRKFFRHLEKQPFLLEVA